MSVLAITEQSVTLEVGDEWLISVETLDDDGYLTDATVAVTVTRPDASTATPTVTEDASGLYVARYTITATGRHLAVATASGAVVGVVPFTAWAQTAVSASGMPDLTAVKNYLGEDNSYSDEDVQDALNAETAAQRSRCRIPANYPDDLAQALKRRVARNLAARSVPVASFTSFEGGATSTRVPQSDPEVVRLEAPYRRRTVG